MEPPMSTGRALESVLVGIRHPGLAVGILDLLAPVFGQVTLVSDEGALIDSAERLRPSLAVLGLSFGPDDGLGLIRRLHLRFPDLRVVVLSLDVSEAVRRTVLAAGADLLILSTDAASELVPAARALLGPPRLDGQKPEGE
jgi:DNA-binding NarL/FixJ family response regulator